MSRTGNIPPSRLEINLFIDGFLQPEAGISSCRPTIGPKMRLRQRYLDREFAGLGVDWSSGYFSFGQSVSLPSAHSMRLLAMFLKPITGR